jgi:hypothetical protein
MQSEFSSCHIELLTNYVSAIIKPNERLGDKQLISTAVHRKMARYMTAGY